jgi:adenylate cyclase, class 2
MMPLNYNDFTIKAKTNNPFEVEQLLKEMNAVYKGSDYQIDTYFKIEKGKLKWRKGKIENLITHYERISEHQLEKTIVYRYDLNPSRTEIEKLFSCYPTLAIIEKERNIFFIDNVKIHLDKTSSEETFIEIEVMDNKGLRSLMELRRQCLAMKSALKIDDRDLLKTGYL